MFYLNYRNKNEDFIHELSIELFLDQIHISVKKSGNNMLRE